MSSQAPASDGRLRVFITSFEVCEGALTLQERKLKYLYTLSGKKYSLADTPESADVILVGDVRADLPLRLFSRKVLQHEVIGRFPNKSFSLSHAYRPLIVHHGIYTSGVKSIFNLGRVRTGSYALYNDEYLNPYVTGHRVAEPTSVTKEVSSSLHRKNLQHSGLQSQKRQMATLRAYPGIAHTGWAKGWVSKVACRRVLAAASPVSTARDLCAEINGAIASDDVEERRRVRRTVAGIWLEIARSLALAPRSRGQEAAYAAARAVAQAPSYLFSRTLLRVLVLCVLGRRIEAWGVGVYARLRRSRHQRSQG